MGKATRRPERATATKPTTTLTEPQRPSWSCSPLTRTEFAHGLPAYLSRINPKYKYFIEYGALHDRGVTFANSKAHIRDLVTGSATKGTWAQPNKYEATPQDIIPSDVESSSDTGDEDAEYEAPAAKTPKSASKTKAASKARQLIYKSYRVDPQRLAELDLELINDITECYDHDETATSLCVRRSRTRKSVCLS